MEQVLNFGYESKKIRYKLFRVRKDGTIGPLFINRKQRVEMNVWLDAEDHPTKGFAHRPGWHLTERPHAPHLKMSDDRVWYMVEVEGERRITRPKSQGGEWILADRIKVLHPVEEFNEAIA